MKFWTLKNLVSQPTLGHLSSYSQLMDREAEAQKMTLFAQGCMGKPVEKKKGIGCASVVSSPDYSGCPFVLSCLAKCITSVNLTLL